MSEPPNDWNRWRGGVDEKLKDIRADLREMKQYQRDQRTGAMQMGGIIGGLVSGVAMTVKWLLSK